MGGGGYFVGLKNAADFSPNFPQNIPCKIWNGKSAQRESFLPDIPADIRPKNFVQALQVLEKKKNNHFGTDIPRGRA